MKAIILVAGSGKRMRPHTLASHKTLLKIGGRTLLQRIVDPLLANDVCDITLVTGYQAAELKQHLAEVYPGRAFNFIHNDCYASSNNIYSMALAMEQLEIDSDVLLIECDLIFDTSVIERLLASPHANVAVVDRHRSGMDGTVVKVRDGMVTDVIPPHLQDSSFDFSDKYKTLNIYRFSREFCAGPFRKLLTYYARVIDMNVYYELILGIVLYLQRESVHALILEDEKWAEVDDPNDLESASFVFDPASRRRTLEGSYGGFWNYSVTDFCYIRNMHFPTGAVLSELRNSLPDAVWNYGSCQAVLDRKLSYLLLCDERNATLLNGASQIFPVLRRFVAGRRVLLPSPTFGEYDRLFPDAEVYPDEPGVSWEGLVARAEGCGMVVFVNPNNPTGTFLPTETLHQYALSHPGQLVVVDESFIDFSDGPGMVPLLEAQPAPNVIVIKSLSKSLGVPGIRLGYCYTSHREFQSLLRSELPVWNINSVAEHFLEIILKHREALQASYQKTMEDRADFARQLQDLSCVEKVYTAGGGNFLLVAMRLSRADCSALVEELIQRHSILVKDVSAKFPGDTAYLRLAVRRPEEHGHLLDCVRRRLQTQDLS